MAQNPDLQSISLQDIREILQSQVDAMPPSPTSTRYRKALASFSASSSREADTPNDNLSLIINNLSLENNLSSELTDWLVRLWLIETPFTTASLYLDIISALYTAAHKAGRLPKTTLFSTLKANLKALGPQAWKSGIDAEIFQRALRLTRHADRLISDDAIAAALILLSLNSSLTPLAELAFTPRAATANQALSSILNNSSLAASRSKYLFPLGQNRRSETQLKRHIARICNDLFRRARLPQASDPNQTVEALWAYAALSAGIPASRIAAALDHLHPGQAPLGLPILKLASSAPHAPQRFNTADDNSSLIINNSSLEEVGKIFLENPPRWYAMSLRPGVSFSQLARRIQLLTPSSSNPLRATHNALRDTQLFYPSEEITRAIGKKIIIRQRPFIHSVVFFKARLTDIGPLFAHIGDLAWCYRRSHRPGAPYAEISQTQFQRFQQTIARFTPDYEVAAAGELELKKNDRVQILGGLFAGREATFVKSQESKDKSEAKSEDVKSEGSNTVYRLNIVGENGIEWRINVDSRLAKQKN